MDDSEKWRLTPVEFQWIREQAGFSRKDVAAKIAARGWSRSARTDHAVKSLECRGNPIPVRYIACLIELVGREAFAALYARVEGRRRWRERQREERGKVRHD